MERLSYENKVKALLLNLTNEERWRFLQKYAIAFGRKMRAKFPEFYMFLAMGYSHKHARVKAHELRKSRKSA